MSRSGEKKTKFKRYETLEDMLKEYNIKNMRSLIELNDDELEGLINIIKLHQGQIEMRNLLKDVKNEDEKIRIFVNEMAKKLCRCIGLVEDRQGQQQTVYSPVAVCVKSIFHKIGITIPRIQCQPVPMLIPKEGTTHMIKKYQKKSTK